MGLAGISPWSLLLILLIVALLFGTKRLRGAGSDLGVALKNLRQGLGSENTAKSASPNDDNNPADK